MSNKQQTASLNHTLAGMSALTSPLESDSPDDRAGRSNRYRYCAEYLVEALLTLSIALIDSAIDIITNHIHTDEQLVHESVLMPGGTVGKHFRHVR